MASMSAPANRDLLRVLAVVGGALGAVWFVWQLRELVLWLLLAMFLAIAADPAVRVLERRVRLSRPAAIATVCSGAAAVLALVGWIFIPPLVDAVRAAVDAAPGYVDRLQREGWVQELDGRFQVIERLRAVAADLPGALGGPDAAVGAAQSVFSGFVAVLTVVIMTIFMLVYGPQARTFVLAQLTPSRRAYAEDLSDRSYRVISGYIVGNLLVSAIAGVTAWITLAITGVPFAPALALWVALTDLIPLIGATLGAIVVVPVAFFQGVGIGLAVLIFFVVYQQVENHLIQPLVMRRTVSMNPLVTLVAVLAGAQLVGVIGALMAIPAVGVAQLIALDVLAARRRRLRLGRDDEQPVAGEHTPGAPG